MARVLNYLDAPMWKLVRELYLQDKVVEALEEAERLGGQDSNDLYAESEVRANGEQWQIRPWLTVEGIPSELNHSLSGILEIVGRECETLSRKFGWNNRESTLVTVLPHDVEAPWMPARWGYFVDKVPYDKICLPHHLAFDEPDLTRTIQHEFMHDVTINVTNGHIPRWLSEAMSTYAEDRLDVRTWRELQMGQAEWLPPVRLDALVETDNRQEELHGAISRAYGQANLVARYLATLGGDEKLREFLVALGDESLLLNIESEVFGRSRTDHALRHVHGISEQELFERAHEWLIRTPVPSR